MRENLEEAWVHSHKKYHGSNANDFLLWKGPSLQIQLFLWCGVIFQLPEGFTLLLVEKPLKPTPYYLVSDKQVMWIWRGAWFLSWPNLPHDLESWRLYPGCVCVCVCACMCTHVRTHACRGEELYKYILFPELCQYQKEGCSCLQGWKEVGKVGRSQGTQRKRKRAGGENHVFIPKTIYLASHFWYSCYYWGREENMLRECSFYLFPLAKPPADRLGPGAIFFPARVCESFGGWAKAWVPM